MPPANSASPSSHIGRVGGGIYYTHALDAEDTPDRRTRAHIATWCGAIHDTMAAGRRLIIHVSRRARARPLWHTSQSVLLIGDRCALTARIALAIIIIIGIIIIIVITADAMCASVSRDL